MAVLDDFHQIKALRLFGALYAEVVDDEKVGFGQASHQLAMGAIEPREFELLKKLLCIVIQRFEAEMTSMMTDSRGQITLAHACGARDDDVFGISWYGFIGFCNFHWAQ